MVGGSKTLLVDVVMIHPCSPSRNNARETLLPSSITDSRPHRLDWAEAAKTRKYEQLAAEMGAEFMPFACDVFGGLGQRAQQLVGWRGDGIGASGGRNRPPGLFPDGFRTHIGGNSACGGHLCVRRGETHSRLRVRTLVGEVKTGK